MSIEWTWGQWPRWIGCASDATSTTGTRLAQLAGGTTSTGWNISGWHGSWQDLDDDRPYSGPKGELRSSRLFQSQLAQQGRPEESAEVECNTGHMSGFSGSPVAEGNWETRPTRSTACHCLPWHQSRSQHAESGVGRCRHYNVQHHQPRSWSSRGNEERQELTEHARLGQDKCSFLLILYLSFKFFFFYVSYKL